MKESTENINLKLLNKEKSDLNPIAVIGMAGVFADSPNLETFWQNLRDKKDLIKEIPSDHFDYLPWFEVSSEPIQDKMYCKWGSFIDDVAQFDAPFFNVSPREAELMDPQLRLLLQVLYTTAEDAGYPQRIKGTKTGMYVGVCSHDYADEMARQGKPISPYDGTGNAATMVANRPSFYFNLTGPSFAVDTACSSSIVALHLACKALQNNECEMAFAAGTNLLLCDWHYRYYCSLGVLSHSGRCHTFDKQADGYVPGEGVGALLLKPLAKAIADNDKIHAIIRGSAINHGGYTPSITAPSTNLEAQVILDAWRDAQINPETIGYIEAHGTGTILGDPVEINGLKKAFKQHTQKENFCAVGSAKAHIGHTEGAAGIAGVIKVILSLKNEKLPAMPQFDELNPYIQLDGSPLYINREVEKWHRINNTPRRAGVSSFGFGGAYGHVVLEEYEDQLSATRSLNHEPQLIVLSAKNEERLKVHAQQMLDFLNKMEMGSNDDNRQADLSLVDIAYTLQVGREAMEERLAVLISSLDDLQQKLTQYLKGQANIESFYRGHVKSRSTQSELLVEGRAGQAFVKILIEDKEIAKLAQLWVTGIDIDWQLLYSNPPRCISLPTYPFQLKHYWFKQTEDSMIAPKTSAAHKELPLNNVMLRQEIILSQLRSLMADLLKSTPSEIEVDTSLLNLGVDSIIIMQAIQKIESAYGLTITARQFFEELNTLNALAGYIDQHVESEMSLAKLSFEQPSKPTLENPSSTPLQITCHTDQYATQPAEITQKENTLKQSLSSAWKMGNIQTKKLTPLQQRHLDALIARYTKRTPKSKQQEQNYRPVFADMRAVLNFRPETKEMCYPITVQSSQGSKLWDLDGNEYIDLTLGFGVHLFGHQPEFITTALENQLKQGIQLGPQSNIAGEVAQLICELTGMQRVTFCNSGTEAVMTALRIARAATGREKIVLFSGSYHGHFDGTLAIAPSKDTQLGAVPMVPGVLPKMVDDVLVLPYGTEQSLETIKSCANELALVLVEPVQSRRPDLQPKAFLHKLREITKTAGTLLIFDEMITGFRTHTGGAQAWFGVEADLATYGKVIGGGMPLGVVAGKADYMDRIDGGTWHYGDASHPKVERTFYAGTFCKHPLTMATTLAVLQHLKKEGNRLQEQLNQRTSQLVETLNAYFKQNEVPIQVVHFSSLFRFVLAGNFSYVHQPLEMDLFYYLMIEKGVYIWEARTCFLSTAHTDEDITYIINAVKESVQALRAGGFLPALPKDLAQNLSQTERVADRKTVHDCLPSLFDVSISQFKRSPVNLIRLSQMEKDFSQVNQFGQVLLLNAFQHLGVFQHTKENDDKDLLIEQLNIVPAYARLFNVLLKILEQAGFIQIKGKSLITTAVLDHPSLRHDLTQLAEKKRRLIETFPEFKAHIHLLWVCVKAYPELLTGKQNFSEVMFPNSSMSLVEGIYQHNPLSDYYNQMLAAVVKAYIQQRLQREPKALIYILEVGAGTGGTSTFVLAAIKEYGPQIRYFYTDISISFTQYGQKTYGANYPFVEFRELNIEQSPESQGFASNSIDLLFGSNVFHATKQINNTLKQTKILLKTHGLLLLNEITQQQDFATLTFGLTKGWWLVEDEELRCPSSPLLSPAQWKNVLEINGIWPIQFLSIPPTPLENSQQCVIVGESDRNTRLTQRLSVEETKDKIPLIDKIPLTDAQRQLWVLSKMGNEGSLAYHLYTSVQLEGTFHLTAMRQAVQQVIDRHEALRTIISHDGDFQQCRRALLIDVPLVDFSGNEKSASKMVDWFQKQSQKAFDLSKGPLFRIHIIKLAQQKHVLALAGHHIITDGWSMGIILQELFKLYSAACQGQIVQLASPLPWQTYIARQTQQDQNASVWATHEDYWLAQFTDSIPALNLPTNRSRPIKTYKANRQSKQLDTVLSHALKKISQEQGCTLFMTLFSVYTLLLHRLSGQNDIIVGIPVSGRFFEGSEMLVGYAANMLPIRHRIQGNPPFSKYLKTLRSVLLQSFEHQAYPYAWLINKLDLRKDVSRSPLVTVTFNLERPLILPKIDELESQLLSQPIRFSASDVHLNVIDLDEKLILDCDYNTDLFDDVTIERWLGYFQTLLESIVVTPQQPIFQLPLLTEHERHQLLVEWNATETDFPQDKCLHQLIEEQVERTPDAIALIFEDQKLTYREFNSKANQLGQFLQEKGIGQGHQVPVFMTQSLEAPIAFLAIMKSGAAYVPLDINWPPLRVKTIIEKLNSDLVLVNRGCPELPTLLNQPVVVEEMIEKPSDSIPNLDIDVNAKAPVYIVFTSGSTGEPKGAINHHRGIINRFWYNKKKYGCAETDVSLQTSYNHFDAAIEQLFWPLINGASTVLPSQNIGFEAAHIMALIAKEKVTFTEFVPSMLEVFLENSENAAQKLRSLQFVIMGGEPMNPKRIAQLQTYCPHIRIINSYGPAETSIGGVFYELPNPCSPSLPSVPVGKPIANVKIFILDQYLNPSPIGVPGEIYIGGLSVSLGYVNNESETHLRFINKRLFDEVECERFYKTGDLARYLPDGNIEFLGRIDHQVKIRGFRIELGEIEAVLEQHPKVKESAILLHETATDKRLVAYILPEGQVENLELRQFLKERLPDYMIPSAWVTLDSLPLTSNGKRDRRALSQLPVDYQHLSEEQFVAPRTPDEERLADIWAEVLEISRVGVHDNFFELGGHSILATQVVSRIHNTFDLDLPLRDVFESPTISELMVSIEKIKAETQTITENQHSEREQIEL